MLLAPVLLGAAALAAPTPASRPADTLRLEVGSPEVDLSRMRPHDAKVTVERLVEGRWEPVVEWTNRLEVGDSSGRAVHRWTTVGTRRQPDGGTITWTLHQTFDPKTIAPLGYRRTGSDGLEARMVIAGKTITGTRRAPDGRTTPLDIRLSRPAFPAAASDLVPMGIALRQGLVMTMPVWQPGMPDVETHIMEVVGRREQEVAGKRWTAWVVEERARRGEEDVSLATWYLVDEPPYMVYGETRGPNGVPQRIIEVLTSRP